MTWTIAGNNVEPTPEIELTASTLSLSFEVPEPDLATWETIGDRAGDLTIETGFGGAFRTLARGEQVDVIVDPAASESPPIATSDWYVDGFSAEQLSPQRHEVSLDLQRPQNRRDEFSLSNADVQTAAGPPTLSLSLQNGAGLLVELGPDQVGQHNRDGSPAGAQIDLPLLVSPEQAAAVVDAAGFPAGVSERTIPDGDSTLVDESGGRQTVGVTSAAGVPLADGDFLIVDWGLERAGFDTRRRFALSLGLRPL